jgi:processive 1,2-diacylglycerol beta-glucosyltransferase
MVSSKKNIHPLGFVDSMRELYSLSDLVITKPGAITVSELIVSHVPFILDTWPIIMPQEKGNVKFVFENDLGYIANKISEIPILIERIFSLKCKNPNLKSNNIRKELYGTQKIGYRILSFIEE